MQGIKILVVDDEPQNLQLMRQILSSDYRLVFATDGQKALEVAAKHRPALILMDIMMPNMDGYQACRKLKSDPELSDIPVIFVTAMGEIDDETEGFDAGGVDYITKPVKAPLVRKRVLTHLSLVHVQELEKTRLLIIQRLGRAAEFKDNETGRHVIRMSHYSNLLAEKIGRPKNWCDLMLQAAPMHDLGKIGIPDNILLKQGPLDEEEWKIMRRHPKIGSDIIGDHNSALLKMAAEIAMTHHEKWNGQGYPRRLKATDIPLSGRITALADVFDALVTDRPYKKAWPVEKAFELIQTEAGGHFDPDLAPAFLNCRESILQIKQKWPEIS